MKKILSIGAAVSAVAILCCTTAFAVDGDFGYLKGKSRSSARADLYAAAEQLPEEDQDEYLAANGIGEEPYSEEAAANYSYVAGQKNGSQFEDDDADKSGYSYLLGKERGASYQMME